MWILSSPHSEFVAEDDNWSGKPLNFVVHSKSRRVHVKWSRRRKWALCRVPAVINASYAHLKSIPGERSHARWLKCFAHRSTWPSHSQSRCRISDCWFWKFAKMGQTRHLRSGLWNAAFLPSSESCGGFKSRVRRHQVTWRSLDLQTTALLPGTDCHYAHTAVEGHKATVGAHRVERRGPQRTPLRLAGLIGGPEDCSKVDNWLRDSVFPP